MTPTTQPATIQAMSQTSRSRIIAAQRRAQGQSITWSPAVRRKVADATAQLDHVSRHEDECWVDSLVSEMPFAWGRLLQAMPGDRGPELHATWRVVPRGQHRRLSLAGQELGAYGSAAWFGHEPQRCYAHDAAEHAANVQAWHEMTARLPRWRRGELLHTKQRRARELWARHPGLVYHGERASPFLI